MPEPTYNLEEASGKVRLLISDIGGGDGKSWLFTDDEILAFLSMWEENVFMAAAIAMRTCAGNEALTAKKITFLELETDGPAVAASLEKMADKLETLSDEQVDFELVEVGADLFSRREIRMEQFGEYW